MPPCHAMPCPTHQSIHPRSKKLPAASTKPPQPTPHSTPPAHMLCLLGAGNEGVKAERIGSVLFELDRIGPRALVAVLLRACKRTAHLAAGSDGLLHAFLLVFVDARLRAVGEQRLVIDVVPLVVASIEARVHADVLVEQAGVVHGLLGGGLGLAQCDSLRHITVGIAVTLVLLASHLEPEVPLHLPLAISLDLLPMPPALGVLSGLALTSHRQVGTLSACLGGEAPELLLAHLLLLGLLALTQLIPEFDFLSRLPLGDVEILREGRKLVVDRRVLQVSAVCLQPFVQRDGVPLLVLPVGHRRRDLPLLLVLLGQLARW
mmetsp:Transcript_45811/g.113864  ORF Transcript_45811/g.113864 Transcript_45811/m.113864 type:complete len:319 (+) Transcript_45811:367-1323(+)